MLLSLFALTNNPASRIVKFELSGPVQIELTEYLKIQEEFFDAAHEEIEFDGKYKPEHDEVLYIDGYDDIDGLENAIINPLGVEPVNPNEDFFLEIKALFTGYETDVGTIKILLQNFDRRKIISTNGLSIFHSNNVYKKIEGIGITVDYKLTATLELGKLKFYSFHTTRQMFDLSEYYKVATDDDVQEFLDAERIQSVDSEVFLPLADSWVRRKISLIQQSGILQNVPIHEMRAAAIDFNIPFVTIDVDGVEVISIPNNKSDLKMLLRFLDEDYYKSPLSKTNFVTNSKQQIVRG
ncbi:DUF4868 domain-containing protein [Shewanella sp. SW36]|uniref:DUF4868 domain-containing protein n=1 Tax=unclassified Shewanella TaxID=196818 RepID=UPI0021DA2272|nr:MULTISPECIES: DUF4868 domain-containing protein [unclassified Shewanella]MCU7976439.1 DUF4868 domain-containing protein [Shewanella sp. SW36]MCU7991679.1 DUF4868 domain-containing protein [Shewanella sp. SW1]MCU8053059.1 DUF4868 domain-containing protein [Shewanella sp. SM43]